MYAADFIKDVSPSRVTWGGLPGGHVYNEDTRAGGGGGGGGGGEETHPVFFFASRKDLNLFN